MAKMTYDGLSAFSGKIFALDNNMTSIGKKVVFDGAGVVADEIRREIDKIPDKLINKTQRQGLRDGLGIAKMRDERGFINTRLGFAGYNSLRIGKYKGTGQPNAMIARVVAKGTSKRPAHYQFVKNAVNNSKQKALIVMQNTLDDEIKKINGR